MPASHLVGSLLENSIEIYFSLKDLAGGRPVVITTVSGTTIKQRASVKIDFKLSATSPDPIFCPAKALTILVALN